MLSTPGYKNLVLSTGGKTNQRYHELVPGRASGQ